MPNGRKYLRPDDVAARYEGQISTGTLANWRTAGVGPRFIKIGGKIFYHIDELERWEERHTKNSTKDYAASVAAWVCSLALL